MKNLIPLFIFACLLKVSAGFSQAEDFSGANICPLFEPEYVKHFEAGTNPGTLLDINVPAGAPASITWGGENDYLGCPTVAMPITQRNNTDFINLFSNAAVPVAGNLRATFNNTVANRSVRISSTGNLAEGEYELTIRLSYSGQNRIKNFRFIVRQAADIVFVLDRSGSMECDDSEDAVGGWPACINGGDPGRRWDVLKESINHFVGKLDMHHTLAADRLSVVYFSGSVIGTFPGNLVNDAAPFNTVASFRDPTTGVPPNIRYHIFNEMSAFPVEDAANPSNKLATDGTSFGLGLVKAFGTPAVAGRYGGASNPARRQLIFLFTDGEQNTGNQVREAGAGVGKVIQVSSADMTPVLDLNGAAAAPVEIYTAGITQGNAVSSLLSNIADGGLGDNYFNVMPGATAEFGADVSTQAFSLIFNQFSPQIVRVEKGKLNPNSSVTANFDFNKRVNRVIFDVSIDSPFGRRANFSIEKDGVDVTKMAAINEGNYLSTFVFNLYEHPEMSSEGKWTFRVNSPGSVFNNTAVSIYATADDEHVEFNGVLEDGKIHVGEKLKPRVTFSALGQPITDADVKATIIKPGEDLGDLLAKAPTPQFPSKTKEVGSCADQKLSALELNNPSALTAWKNLKSTTISLKHTGKGIYEGEYDDVDLTGNYKIIYTATATSADLGKIERRKEQTINVRFAPIDLSSSVRSVKSSRDGKYFFTYGFKPTFVDPNGKKRFLGPGFENAIMVEGASFSRTEDHCDGSYSIFFNSPSPNPNVKVWVSDETVYSGGANEFDQAPASHKFTIAFHGGITQPVEQLDSLYDGNYAAEIDLGWQFNRTFGAELIGGYYSFKPDFKILGATALLKARINGGNPLQLFAGVGGGYYKPDNIDATPGACVRLGLEYFPNQRFSLGVDVAGFTLPDPDYSFGIVTGVLRFRL